MPRPDSLTIAVLLTVLVSLGPLSTDLYLPALPTLERAFATDMAAVQLTLSVFLAGFAVAQLVCGPLSDRFGRRPVLLGGVAVYVVASVACTLATSVDQLIVGRLFQAFGGCCGPVLARAVVRDVYGRERAARMYAYMAMAMALAPAAGPIIGGLLVGWPGWRATFGLLALIGVALLVAVWCLLEETNTERNPDAVDPERLLGNYLLLLGERSYRGYVLCFAAVFSSLFTFISGSSFVLIDGIGLTPVQYGFCFAAVVGGYMAGSFVSGGLTVRLGLERMILGGLIVTNLGSLAGFGLAAAGVASVPAIIAPMALVMAGAGLVLPNAMAGAIAPFGSMAGTASALLGFTQMLVAAVVGALIGQIGDTGPLAMMSAIAFANLLAVLAYLGHRRHW